jgi:phage-related holin
MVFVTETIDYRNNRSLTLMENVVFFYKQWNKTISITNTQGSCGCTVPTSPKSQQVQKG